jgi:hypothetical protein
LEEEQEVVDGRFVADLRLHCQIFESHSFEGALVSPITLDARRNFVNFVVMSQTLENDELILVGFRRWFVDGGTWGFEHKFDLGSRQSHQFGVGNIIAEGLSNGVDQFCSVFGGQAEAEEELFESSRIELLHS